MQWQILKAGIPDPVIFDDGIWAQPGDDAFIVADVRAEMTKRGGDGFSFVGRSTKVATATEDQIAPRVEDVIIMLMQQAVDQGMEPKSEEIAAEARVFVLKDMGLHE